MVRSVRPRGGNECPGEGTEGPQVVSGGRRAGQGRKDGAGAVRRQVKRARREPRLSRPDSSSGSKGDYFSGRITVLLSCPLIRTLTGAFVPWGRPSPTVKLTALTPTFWAAAPA